MARMKCTLLSGSALLALLLAGHSAAQDTQSAPSTDASTPGAQGAAGSRLKDKLEAMEQKQTAKIASALAEMKAGSKGEVLVVRLKPEEGLQRKAGEVAELGKNLSSLAGLEGSVSRVVSKDTLLLQLATGKQTQEAVDALLQHDAVYQMDVGSGGEAAVSEHRRAADTTPFTARRRQVLAAQRSSGRQKLKEKIKEKVKAMLKGRRRGKQQRKGKGRRGDKKRAIQGGDGKAGNEL